MKALTLWRPWPRLILEHGKDIENRTWKPPVSILGKRIAIHAGKQVDSYGISRIMTLLKGDAVAYGHDMQDLCGPEQVIVGTVVVLGWVRPPVAPPAKREWGVILNGHAGEIERYNSSPWLEGPYGWALFDPQPLRSPLPCKGRQGLWTVPGDIEQEIRDQMDRARGFNNEGDRIGGEDNITTDRSEEVECGS